PAAVNKWIKAGRTTKTWKLPKVPNVATLARQWDVWWNFLQPAWRVRGHDGKWMTGGEATYGADDAWGRLDNPGPNGCLSVVACLYIWGVYNKTESLRVRWLEAVQDVAWMLEGLAASMETSK
ncbi:hypothetical protein DFH06DRAFT_974721, partial [Mycena polygramma]